jgi:hypothetical protein
MYQTIKDNIINPKVLLERSKRPLIQAFGFFVVFALLLTLPSIIEIIAFQTLTPNNKTAIRQSLSNELDIPCRIDQTLQCDLDDVFVIEQGNVFIVFDPSNQYEQTNGNLVVLLQQDRVQAFANRLLIASSSYIANPTDLIQWPTAWQSITFNTTEESFWTTLYQGLDELLLNYASLWKTSFVISLIISSMLVFAVDVLLDSVILRFVLRSGVTFVSILKVVIHAMTLYVLILLLFNLFQVNVTPGLQLLLQLQPILYSVIAIRIPKEPTIDV